MAGKRQRLPDERPSAARRGYGGKWRQAAKTFLAMPENARCACGCGRPANMVDHRIAHKGDMKLFWDRKNWQPMNVLCNSRKAVLTEGAFGNARSSRPYGSPGCHADGTPRDANHYWNKG
jgi:5-methylcytosine-specific restriction endonuclease McrA